MSRYAAMLALLLSLGCGAASPATAIKVEDVPENLMKIAKEKLPEVTFEQALKRADGTYEIRGKDKRGKSRDIDMTATGEVIEIE
ncbi:MAG: hypothetical protein NT013_09285 [Planctomycetia bacterium]|nr:hypothetical protein [Planctomycetia bacterium]